MEVGVLAAVCFGWQRMQRRQHLKLTLLMAGHSAKPASGFMHAFTISGEPEGVVTAGTLVGGAIGEAVVTTGADVILGTFVEVGVQAASRL